MSRHNVCCQSSDTEKRIFCPTEVIRIEKRIEIKNKDYVPCSTCKSYLLYSSAIVDEKGNSIPLDINGKRHFCNAGVHEVKDIQNG